MMDMSKLSLGCVLCLGCFLSWTPAQDGPPPVRDYATDRSRLSGPSAITNLLVPNSSALAAAADIMTVPQPLRYQMRYLSLYNIAPPDRIKLIRTLNFAINSISRARTIRHLQILPNTEDSVVRLCMADYQFYDEVKKKTFGWRADVWDRFADSDPYFHADLVKTTTKIIERTVTKYRTAVNQYGQQYQQPYEEIIQDAQQSDSNVRAAPPWCDPNAVATLVANTKSTAPLLRADWFLQQILLPPFYYDMLDLGQSQDDFFDMLFADEKQIERARLEIKGVVVRSGAGVDGIIPVARNNRALIRYQSLLGYLWLTHDTDSNIDDQDYLRVLQDEKFKATELIGTGRNGLQFYFLAQGNAGKQPKQRQDEAPIEIAVDNTNADRRVRNGRSCITCHVEGLRPFKPLPQEMVSSLIDIVSPSEEKARHLRDTFVTNVHEFVAEDSKVYARAVRSCNGMTTEDNANQYGRFYNQYGETPITAQMVQYELGTPLKDLLPLLANAQNDPYLLGLSRNEPLFAVRREHWEKSFQQAMILVLQAHQNRR